MRRTLEERAVERDLDRLLRSSSSLRVLTKRVLRAQIVLESLASDGAWHAYLDVEAAARAREIAVRDAAIAIALRRGRVGVPGGDRWFGGGGSRLRGRSSSGV